jgi:uncharacterized protein YjbI with pentapeptide repeats
MKLVLCAIIVVAAFIWYGFQGKSVRETTGSEINSDMPATNFTGADLSAANLLGVSLDGVILCNTTMPDGTINNTSCKN